MRRDDPDNDQVPGDGHQQNQRERDRPERHAPRRLREPVGVGQVRGVSGQDMVRCEEDTCVCVCVCVCVCLRTGRAVCVCVDSLQEAESTRTLIGACSI